MKRIFLIATFVVFFFISTQHAYAISTYVLPYPGVMPGSKLYPVYELLDWVKELVAFGDFARFSFYLSQSDKYLVESKTLFEYNQFLLALHSLEKSNRNLQLAKDSLESARKNNKPTQEKSILLSNAVERHTEVLKELIALTPEYFTWEEEKKNPVQLRIHDSIQNAMHIRAL